MKKPVILITNDDGYNAPGIKRLIALMTTIGDVIVVAPDGPRSGQSNALTVTRPIGFSPIETSPNLKIYSCTGTPTDCVKLALNDILDQKPDLLVSGINHGSNAAINVIYSGTMGATLEACGNSVPAIGFSICDHGVNADFSFFEKYILNITEQTLKNGLPHGVCLNVNAPNGALKGVRVVRQADGFWAEEFEKRRHPFGNQDYYWLTGYFHNNEPNAKDTDEWALAHGFVSIVPTKIDMTAHEHIKRIAEWDFREAE
ncbi:MAG: 5'/3'-nucleotidase SurE [Prevotellaceae bacterium]|jgi:5'-nucleotidase|nr:5'/3'-nucleotidase SurE [Prevotellaceae bacterium]